MFVLLTSHTPFNGLAYWRVLGSACVKRVSEFSTPPLGLEIRVANGGECLGLK